MILYHWTPLPPKPNGIADYAALLNKELSEYFDLACVNDNPFSIVPSGIQIIDPAQAWREAPADVLPVYQIGNNSDHTGIIRAALDRPGLTVLHDARLLYLHELMQLDHAHLEAMLIDSNPVMARLRRHSIAHDRRKRPSDYVCFDMTGDLLRRSRMVLVHSHFTRTILLRHHGAAFADRIAVLPHFAIEPTVSVTGDVREQLGVPEGALLIVTSGFATRAKRFDWMAEVLSALAQRGHDIFWVHAGAERPAEFNLSALIASYPPLAGRTCITGYVDEASLDAWLAAADIVLNLRFPSMGESSGTLARALSMGRCCVVTRTAAYDEVPDHVVAKCSPYNPITALDRTLSALAALPEARAALGRNARTFARTHLSIKTFARNFADLCLRAQSKPPIGDALINRRSEGKRVVLGAFDPAEITTELIQVLMPRTFVPSGIEMYQSNEESIRVEALGLDISQDIPR